MKTNRQDQKKQQIIHFQELTVLINKAFLHFFHDSLSDPQDYFDRISICNQGFFTNSESDTPQTYNSYFHSFLPKTYPTPQLHQTLIPNLPMCRYTFLKYARTQSLPAVGTMPTRVQSGDQQPLPRRPRPPRRPHRPLLVLRIESTAPDHGVFEG